MHVPAELSVSEFAFLLGIPRKRVVRRLQSGAITGVRIGTGPRSKWVIPLQVVQNLYPTAWESVLLRLRLLNEGTIEAA